MFARRQIWFLHFVVSSGYVTLCSMMVAIGDVVAGDLRTLRFIFEECGSFFDEGSLGHYNDRRGWRQRFFIVGGRFDDIGE